MKFFWTIARVAGIPVRAHVTLLLLLLWIATVSALEIGGTRRKALTMAHPRTPRANTSVPAAMDLLAQAGADTVPVVRERNQFVGLVPLPLIRDWTHVGRILPLPPQFNPALHLTASRSSP